MLTKLAKFTRRTLGQKKGQAVIEYALLLAGVVLVVFGAMNMGLKAKFTTAFGNLMTYIEKVVSLK